MKYDMTPRNGLRGLIAAAALALAAAVAWAQQPVQLRTETDLRASPAFDAKVLARLPVGTRGTQVSSSGKQASSSRGWIQVRMQNLQGWVRSETLASAAAPAPAQSPLAAAFTGASNTPTPTTGTRGLTTEQLANAQPAPAEVELLDRYAATPAQAEQHARAGRLAAQRIEGYNEGAK